MIAQKMVELGKHRSAIREIFEYSKKRKLEIGDKNVFDFSLGNPSVPAPESVERVNARTLRKTIPRLSYYEELKF